MDNYVSKEEFNNLKLEFQELKKETDENRKLLQQIDKKIDLIGEKLANSEKIDELKLHPIVSRVQKLEDNQGWLAKTIGATIVGIVIKVIVDITKIIN